MKKFPLLLFVFLFQALYIHAQDERPFRVGLTISPSMSWYSPEKREFVSEGARLGYAFGLIGDFRLGDFTSISTGLNISNFGGKLSYDDRKFQQITKVERTYKLRNLEVPLTIKLNTPEIGYLTYFGRFGFAPGVNLRAKADDSFIVGNPYIEEVDIKGQTPLVRLALVIGLGAEYSLGGKVSLFGGLTYNNGFTNNMKGEVLGVKPSANASYVLLNLGVML